MITNRTWIYTMTNSVGSTAPLGTTLRGFFPNVICIGLFILAIPLIFRLIHSTFERTTYWRQYDPFFRQKDEAFKSSKTGVLELAERFREFAESRENAKNPETEDPEEKKLLFVCHSISDSCNEKLTLIFCLAGGDGAYLLMGQCIRPFVFAAR